MNVHSLVDWLAQRINGRRVLDNNWVEELEARLPQRLPVSFRSLIGRYEFEPFELGGVLFFGNTREAVEQSHELRLAIFRDPALAEILLPRGYIQIGRPDTGDYDPICFDTSHKKSQREFPIVRIDHESILCDSQIRVTQVLAPSFYKLIEAEVSPPPST